MCWDQREAGTQVPPGTYGVTFTRDQYKDRVAFQVIADPVSPTTTRPPSGVTPCT
jgi:hypothetical protein